jgi:xanthine dehydrogenase YagT iron-sulfur-binding subunit
MENRNPDTPPENDRDGVRDTRRTFLKQSSLLTAYALAPMRAVNAAQTGTISSTILHTEPVPVTIEINGTRRSLSVEPRVTLLDLLREQLDLTGTKKGCDYGQCGACTVHVDGQRVLACLSLAVMQNGRNVTTIEGLASGQTAANGSSAARLHPMQTAFIKHDGFQCGYCTPGQIMSAVGCIREGHADSPAEIQEYMSGNICRCGAYSNIVAAIEDVKKGGQKV